MRKYLTNSTKSLAQVPQNAYYVGPLPGGKKMANHTEAELLNQGPGRWMLIRDVAVLQVKLIFDGLRDLVLVPVSLIMAIISLMNSGARPGPQFYDLMRFGKETEQWINLFEAAERAPESSPSAEQFAGKDIDSMVSRVEAFVVEEYKKGGLTAQAKDHFDKVLDAMRRKAGKQNSPKD